jgi:hypothetical protein
MHAVCGADGGGCSRASQPQSQASTPMNFRDVLFKINSEQRTCGDSKVETYSQGQTGIFH